VLTFTPAIKDSDKTLSCRAESGKSDTVNNRHSGKPDSRQYQSVDVDSSDGWKINIFREYYIDIFLIHFINTINIVIALIMRLGNFGMINMKVLSGISYKTIPFELVALFRSNYLHHFKHFVATILCQLLNLLVCLIIINTILKRQTM